MLEVDYTSKKLISGVPCNRCHGTQYTILDNFLSICNGCRKLFTVNEIVEGKRAKIIISHGAQCEKCGLDDIDVLGLHQDKKGKRLIVLCANCHKKLRKITIRCAESP